MLKRKLLKDNSLVSIDDLIGHLTFLSNNRCHRFISYRRLKEYVRLSILNYEDLSDSDKLYLERLFFRKKRRMKCQE